MRAFCSLLDEFERLDSTAVWSPHPNHLQTDIVCRNLAALPHRSITQSDDIVERRDWKSITSVVKHCFLFAPYTFFLWKPINESLLLRYYGGS